MVVKILSSSGTFKGVRYNTDKVDAKKGELIKVVNFGPLQALNHQKPEDYVRYLKMISGLNKNIKSPQFHVALSTKGRTHTKEELTVIAEKWLGKMGYQNQPYLIVFHKDTRNNHVHIVSTRVDRDGQKISSAFEKNRAIQTLNQVMGLNEELQAAKHFEDALGYKFSTKAQFMLILESHNYTIAGTADRMDLIKFGRVVGQFDVAAINRIIAASKVKITDLPGKLSAKEARARQLTAIFNKYLNSYSAALYRQTGPLPGGREQFLSTHTSDFAVAMKRNHGVEIIFHSKDGKLPYGYSIIDHSADNKYVYKGGEIMDIIDLLKDRGVGIKGDFPGQDQDNHSVNLDQNKKGTLTEKEIPTSSIENLSGEKLEDTSIEAQEIISDFENKSGNTSSSESYSNSDHPWSPDFSPFTPDITIDIADDIDDEGILGRNRRRQKKARTNTR